MRIVLDVRQVDLARLIAPVSRFFFFAVFARRYSLQLVYSLWSFSAVDSRRVSLLAGYLHDVEGQRDFMCDNWFRYDDS